MADYWSRLEPEMKGAGLTVSSLAERLGISYQAVRKVKLGGDFNSENNLAAAKLFGLNPEWLATGKGPKRFTPPTSVVARSLSHEKHDDPPLLTWEEMVQKKREKLPRQFRCAVPDDALAPMTPRGTVLIFDTMSPPQPGGGVLVEDTTGARYVRRFQPGPAGTWVAAARNDAYPPMPGDGLTIVAAATGRMDGAV